MIHINIIVTATSYSVGCSECVEGDLIRYKVMHHCTESQSIGKTLRKVADVDILRFIKICMHWY